MFRKGILPSALALASFFASPALSKDCESSEFYGSTKVVDLCDSNFPDKSDDMVWMIEFYAPWCGHCKALKPKYISAAKTVKKSKEDGIKFGAVDCTKEQYICQKYGIKGYPTIKAYVSGKMKEYQGPREEDDMIRFVKSLRDSKGTKGGSAKCSSSLVDTDKKDAIALCDAHFPDKKSKNSWVVVFHPSIGEKSKTKSTKKDLYSLAEKVVSGGAKLGVVDCGKSEQFCEQTLGSDKPSDNILVKIFKKGEKKLSTDSYTEGIGQEGQEDLINFIQEQIGPKFKISKPANEEL